MLRFSLSPLLLLGAALCFLGCEPTASIVIVPSDCGFDMPMVAFSNPTVCRPELTRFDISSKSIGAGPNVPTIPYDCTAEGVFEIAELPAGNDGEFILHIYNGSGGNLQLRVYGAKGCGDIEPITACTTVSAIADKVKVRGRRTYDRYFVRFTRGIAPASAPAPPGAFVALSAYDNAEPKSAGSIAYEIADPGDSGKDYPRQRDNLSGRLAFNCDGTAFQRLVLHECEQDAELLQEWAKRTGLPVSEQYYGPKGNVVVLAMPEGMDLNTGGDGARTVKPKINTGGGGTVEPDYLINLFTPGQPALTNGRLPTFFEDGEVQSLDIQKPYIGQIMPPFDPPGRFNFELPQVLVTIIDSGVDVSDPNRDIWRPSTYDGGLETEFVKTDELGFDFIEKDLTPNDLTPHGTYVAGALINTYQQENPLRSVHFRIFGKEGISSYFGALVSLYEAAAIGSDIVNLSWGIRQATAPRALECAINVVVHSGAHIVTSAGNYNGDLSRDPQWPANFSDRYPKRMATVSSYWYKGEGLNPKRDPAAVVKKDFSNYSPQFSAVAAYMTTTVPAYGRNGDVIYPLGTSISTPVIAGRLAEQLTLRRGDALTDLLRRLSPAPGLGRVTGGGLYLPLAPPTTGHP